MTQDPSPAAATASMAARIAGLAAWSWSDLAKEWHRLFGVDPPVSNRRFVEKRIAHRWQEIEFAKTDRALLDRNRRRIDELVATGSLSRHRVGAVPVAGTELIRTYDGRCRASRARAFADGEFEYAGKRYPQPVDGCPDHHRHASGAGPAVLRTAQRLVADERRHPKAPALRRLHAQVQRKKDWSWSTPRSTPSATRARPTSSAGGPRAGFRSHTITTTAASRAALWNAQPCNA